MVAHLSMVRLACAMVGGIVAGGLATVSAAEVGTTHREVVDLTTDNFQSMITDPANPKWLIKFYAPWCGHCKKLAPVLDEVAPATAGQLAVGKIDCTTQRALCDQYNVRAYPTLKYSVDGALQDYPGGRKPEEFTSFAKKISKPIVQDIASVQEALAYAEKDTDDGVVFVAYHPDLQGDSVEDQLQSTSLTQIYAQVARKEQVSGHFLLLKDPSSHDFSLLGVDEGAGPLVCRVEAHVPPRCFTSAANATTDSLHEFVRAANVATVTPLGPHNFHKVGRVGRPLAIAVIDTKDDKHVQQCKQALSEFAISGPETIRNKYYYGYMDGNQWNKFLAQFNVSPSHMPQVFVLDVPSKEFWQDASYEMNVDKFLSAIDSGDVKSQIIDSDGLMQQVFQAIHKHRPWSIVLLVLFFLALGILIISCFSPPEPFDDPRVRNITARDLAAARGHKMDDSKKDK
jgi:protein disulfide-isomerase A1